MHAQVIQPAAIVFRRPHWPGHRVHCALDDVLVKDRGFATVARQQLPRDLGLDQFDALRPGIVFTDLGMPDLNGWDLASAVKARQPGTQVVLVTGWGTQIEPGTARARGVDFILPKPFALEDVERVIRQAIDATTAAAAA